MERWENSRWGSATASPPTSYVPWTTTCRPGYPDMREHGFDTDEWSGLFERVIAADTLLIGSPIWLGEKSSVCTRVIERLYGNSAH
jgi:multimeric flavodoxin WrbA